MSTPEERLAEYLKSTRAGGQNYPFVIVIDNRTDINFDDSAFAWDYSDVGGGGMVAGHHWAANSALKLTVQSGGCVKTVHGLLKYSGKAFNLPPFPAPPPDKCRAQVGWVIRYQDSALIGTAIAEQELIGSLK